MLINGRDLENYKGTNRAGVIPFTVHDNQLYFLLGIDRHTRELTDFGGGVKADETSVGGALRELDEESCKLFGRLTEKHLCSRSVALINSERNIAIFFLHVHPRWIDIAERKFIENQAKLAGCKKYNELIGIKWVNQNNFKFIAFNRRSHCMWKKIQNLFCWNTTWNELRLTLMLGPSLMSDIRKSWCNLTRELRTPRIMAC